VRVTAAAKAGDLAGAQRVDAAYEVLRHPSRRAAYDRTGIIPEQRRLPPDERFIAPPPPVAHRRWSPASPRRARAGLRERARFLVVSLIALAVAGGLWQGGMFRQSSAALRSDIWGVDVASATLPGPPTHLTAKRQRLIPAVKGPSGAGGYLAGNARWDPCQPIRYVISGIPPFPGAVQLLSSAIKEVSRASGLLFVYAGTTDESATEKRSPYQPERYGSRWAPVLVAWTDPTAVSRLSGSTVGIGGASSAAPDGATPRLVSGIVYLDAPELTTMRQRSAGAQQVRSVMLHELGHLVGLQHVNDSASIMFPQESSAVQDYSVGDLRGLAFAGSGPCPAVR
jgi:hypothetical protein